MERAVEILSLSIVYARCYQSQLKFFVDRQCCCQLNVVIEVKKGEFWQGKETRWRQQESTPVSIFQEMFFWCMSVTTDLVPP